VSLASEDAVERALAVSALAWNPEPYRPKGGETLREVFWRFLRDDAPTVRKAATSALRKPESKEERAQFWKALHREEDMGVRGHLAIMLLDGADADSLDDWVPLAKDPNWSARWCAIKVLRKHYPDAPRLEYAFVPEDIDKKAESLFSWYRRRNGAQ
jgi:HEAT repeat protein